MHPNDLPTRVARGTAFFFVRKPLLVVRWTLISICLGAFCLGVWGQISPLRAASPELRRRVLIIYSFDDSMPWQAAVRVGLQERLEAIAPEARPDIYEERIDGFRIGAMLSSTTFVDYLRAKYSGIAFDLVVAESGFATQVLQLHPDLFSNAARYAIDSVGGKPIEPSSGDVRFVNVIGDWAEPTVRIIHTVLPEARRLIAVVDNSPIGITNKQSLLAAADTLPKGMAIEVWDDFSFDELWARAAHLPPDNALLCLAVFVDRDGRRERPRTVARRLAQAAAVPVFAAGEQVLGTGVVGGRMASARREGQMIVDLGLGGRAAEHWADPIPLLNPTLFDDVALKRWNIPDDRLPSPFEIVNRTETVWQLYRWQIGTTLAALLAEGLLIAWLIVALRQRKAAIAQVMLERDGLELRVDERTAELLAATRWLEDGNRRLEALANTDALTKVANRRKFFEVADQELLRARRYDRPLSFLMIDIDHFKSINDRYGHAAGDRVIEALAETCRSQLRESDCMGRLGGEEFAVLLPEIGAEAAAVAAERIRALVETMRVRGDAAADLAVTVSIGASSGLGGDDTLEALRGRADAALYRAKQHGRNRVVVDPASIAVVGHDQRA